MTPKKETIILTAGWLIAVGFCRLRLGWWPSNYMQCGKRAAIFTIYGQLTRSCCLYDGRFLIELKKISVIFMSCATSVRLGSQVKKFFDYTHVWKKFIMEYLTSQILKLSEY